MTGSFGQFDLSGQAFKRDPFPTLAAMRAAGPLVTMRAPIVGEMTFATTHAAVEELLKSPDRFSVDLTRAGKSPRVATVLRGGPRNLRLLARNMLQQDDPEHRRLRKLVDGAFRRADFDAMRPRIERLADSLLDDLTASEDRDLVRQVARDLPLAVICEMLGQPIMALLASADADPAAFDQPERLDIGRERNRRHAFGGGPHFRLGAWLARAEMEILLTGLLARAPKLALAVPEADLRWTSRLGIRALTKPPLKF